MITRRELAMRSFWSMDPLVQLYLRVHETTAFTLRQLIAFAEQLDDQTFAALCRGELP